MASVVNFYQISQSLCSEQVPRRFKKLKDYWMLNAAIALGTGSVLGLLINPGATPAIAGACALTSLGSFWAVKRIEKRRLDRSSKSLNAKIYHLSVRAQTIQESVLIAEDQRTRLQMEIAGHQNQVMALEAARKRITGETAAIETQLLSLQVEKKLLEASLDQPLATKAINTLKQNNRTKDRIAAQQESLATLTTEIAERSLEQQQLTAKIEDLVAERTATTAKCKELKTQEKQLQQSLQHLQTQVTQQSILQTQVTELHQEREQLQESIDWLRTDRDQIIAQSQSQLQELLEKEQAMQRSVKELEKEALKYEQTQERVDALYKEWQELEDSMKQLAEQKATRESEVTELQPIIQMLEESRSQFMSEVAALTTQKDLLGESTAELATQITDQEAAVAEIQPLLQTLEESRSQVLAELAELAIRQQQQESLLAQLATQKAAGEAEIASIQPTVTNLEQTHAQLMAEVTELRSQKARLDQASLPTENLSIGSAIEQSSKTEPLFSDSIPWQEKFTDEKIRAVFEHLSEYGSLTEAELTQMLEGNPRKARQFALKFDEYLMHVPFAARVEVGAAGKRYVRN
jgi:chromosome segregation ATPase